jgi:DNA polymerase-1
MERPKIELNLEQAEEKKAKRTRKSKEVMAGEKPKSAKKLTKKEQQIQALAAQTVMPDHYETVWTREQMDELCEWISRQELLAIDTETMGLHPWKDEIVGISFYAPHKGYYIPLKHISNIEKEEDIPVEVFDTEGNSRAAIIGVDYVRCLPRDYVAEKLKPLLEDKGRKLLLHNAKFDMHILRNWMNIRIDPYFDTMIAQALLDENVSKALKDIAPRYLKVAADRFATIFGKTTFDKAPILINPETRTGNLSSYYAIKDTELTYRMYEFQLKHLSNPKLRNLYNLMFDVEMPFLRIVARAEEKGVKIDVPYLKDKVAVELHQELAELKQKIWAYTGQININSPAQLSEALYVKLGLPRVNEEKPNSTDTKTLKRLKKVTNHPVIGFLQDYRQKSKLTQAFADKLPDAVVEGRIHTSFNTVGTKTGRMSSNNPNLQQIPAKIGGLIRNAFIADENRLLASIDFSQQELRVLAHVSKDEVLLNAYRNGLDIHSLTASGMFNTKYPEWACSYEDFEYYRNMKDLFLDADGNLIDSKLTDADYIEKLFSEDAINTKDVDELRLQVKKGIYAEKVRKDAKVINFGRHSKLCRSKTLLKTVKPTVMSRGHAKVIPCRSAA